MAVIKIPLMKDSFEPGKESPVGAWYYVCDTDGELPTDAREGDLAYSKESQTQSVRTRTTWDKPTRTGTR